MYKMKINKWGTKKGIDMNMMSIFLFFLMPLIHNSMWAMDAKKNSDNSTIRVLLNKSNKRPATEKVVAQPDPVYLQRSKDSDRKHNAPLRSAPRDLDKIDGIAPSDQISPQKNLEKKLSEKTKLLVTGKVPARGIDNKINIPKDDFTPNAPPF